MLDKGAVVIFFDTGVKPWYTLQCTKTSDKSQADNLLFWLIPLPDDKILDRSKLKQSADNNFEFDENSRKFSKRVENTVGKGEIARYE